jgi:hypothetical protein
MKSKRFKNKRFTYNLQGNPKGAEQVKDETEKKDPSGPKFFECSGFGHI